MNPTVSTSSKERIQLSDGYVFRNEFGFIECVPDPDVELTVDRLEESMDAIETLAANNRVCILMMTHPRSSMSKEARNYPITERKLNYTLAQAIVVTSMSTLLLANFYVKMKKFPFPYRVFKSREKAIEWLQEKELEAQLK